MEHTKGEWKARSLFDRWHVEYDDFATICDIWAGGEEAKANAQLIAAAPNMYEALKELEYCIMNINSIEGARHRASVINANKALAKAEGK